MNGALILLGLVAVLLLLRQPLLVMLLAALAVVHIIWGKGQLDYIIEDMWVSLDKELILAIPLFMLCGGVMTRGSTAKRLIRIAETLTCRIPGGLGVSCILASMVFSAISGSSIVTMLAIGTVMYPAMLEAGYAKRFALGAVLAGGSLGVVLPPSIPLIIFGLVTETSIVDLFVAGLLPGLLLVGLFSAYAILANRKLKTKPFNFVEFMQAMRSGIFAIMMPILLLGGIYSGHFTTIEAAAIALLYALIVEIFIHKEVRIGDFHQIVVDVAKMSGSLFPLLAVALSLSMVLTEQHVPAKLVEMMQTWFSGPISFMIAVNILLVIVSCLMTTTEALLILGPLLTPVAVAYGYDKVFFGIVMIHNLEIGFLLPPLGLNLLIGMTAFKAKLVELTKAAIPFIILMILGLVIIIWQPWIALALVSR
jgi:C4-dicarboxylate transporter DctM subunit